MGSSLPVNGILPMATAFHMSKNPESLLIPVGRRSLLSSVSTSRAVATRLRCKCQLSSEIAPVTSAAYGIVLLSGGLVAYTRSGSKGSLFGGLTGGGLMSTAYFLMQVPEIKEIGYALAFGSALLFAAVFGIRFTATRKIVPAGLLLGLSIAALTVFISPYLHD